MSRFASPSELNPLKINPLRGIVDRYVDFDRVHRCSKLKLFMGNPPLFPLFYETNTPDVVLIQINPRERRETPRAGVIQVQRGVGVPDRAARHRAPSRRPLDGRALRRRRGARDDQSPVRAPLSRAFCVPIRGACAHRRYRPRHSAMSFAHVASGRCPVFEAMKTDFVLLLCFLILTLNIMVDYDALA